MYCSRFLLFATHHFCLDIKVTSWPKHHKHTNAITGKIENITQMIFSPNCNQPKRGINSHVPRSSRNIPTSYPLASTSRLKSWTFTQL